MQKYDSFYDMLNSCRKLYSSRPAFYYENNGTVCTLSYQEFYDEVMRHAEIYRQQEKTCLGVLCDGSLDSILTVFAAVMAGMQTVLLGPRHPEEVLKEQIQKTDIDMLWGEPELVSGLSPCLTAGVSNVPQGQILFFTSGTTSKSKAVVLTDQTLMASAWNGSSLLPLTPDDILLCILPLYHVYGFVCSLLWGLSCGAGVAIGRGARYLTEDPSLFHPTHLSAVPSLLFELLNHNALNPELKCILVGAGTCPPEYISAARERNIQVCVGYGMTETSSGIAMSLSGDPGAMEICPECIVTIAPDGEILVMAPSCMMKGYYKDPRGTSKVLKNGVLSTGDLGILDGQKRLRLYGRKKETLVFSDGSKLSLPEYEDRLRKEIPCKDLAVIEKGHSPELLLRDCPLSREQVEAVLSPIMEKFPKEQRIRSIQFTSMPFPRTPNGKIKRWLLQ